MVGLVLHCLLAGCNATPGVPVHRVASENSYQKLILQGGIFSHVAYLKPSIRNGTVLHVYIDHDGVPRPSRYALCSDWTDTP